MKNTKFVVKVNRGGSHAPEYVQRIDRTSWHCLWEGSQPKTLSSLSKLRGAARS